MKLSDYNVGSPERKSFHKVRKKEGETEEKESTITKENLEHGEKHNIQSFRTCREIQPTIKIIIRNIFKQIQRSVSNTISGYHKN